MANRPVGSDGIATACAKGPATTPYKVNDQPRQQHHVRLGIQEGRGLGTPNAHRTGFALHAVLRYSQAHRAQRSCNIPMDCAVGYSTEECAYGYY